MKSQDEKSKSVMLGSLGLMVYFNYKETRYRTITHPPSNTSPSFGTRWCLNMQTIKAEYLFCRTRVVVEMHNN
jgi:hypothetical protein